MSDAALMVVYICGCTAAFLLGCTVTTWYWERKFKKLKAELNKLQWQRELSVFERAIGWKR